MHACSQDYSGLWALFFLDNKDFHVPDVSMSRTGQPQSNLELKETKHSQLMFKHTYVLVWFYSSIALYHMYILRTHVELAFHQLKPTHGSANIQFCYYILFRQLFISIQHCFGSIQLLIYATSGQEQISLLVRTILLLFCGFMFCFLASPACRHGFLPFLS